MFSQANLWARYQQVVMYIAGLCVLGSLFPISTGAQVTWTLTIDFSSEQDKPVYSVSQSGTSACNYPTPKDAYFLNICAGDSVVWNAKTKSGNYKLKIFFHRPCLDDSSGTLAQWFSGDNAPTTGGKTDGTINFDPHEEYRYDVAVYDTSRNKVFVHDPKIIVGTGGKTAGELLQSLEANSEALSNLLKTDSNPDVKTNLTNLHDAIHNLQQEVLKKK